VAKDSSVIELIFPIANQIHFNCVKKEFEKHGFNTKSHPPLLFILHDEIAGKKASQKELSYILGIKPSTFAVLIKRIEKAELIEKVPDENDLRCNVITPTDKGKKLVNESANIFSTIDKKMYQGFTEKEKA